LSKLSVIIGIELKEDLFLAGDMEVFTEQSAGLINVVNIPRTTFVVGPAINGNHKYGYLMN
jgi:hypothetical protein